MTLYANWTGKFYTVSFNIGTYGEEDVESVQVQYGQPFTLPVAESYENTMAFGGWYADPNGQGLQFADYEGNSVADWNIAGDITVHAYWAAIFSFNKIQGGYSVSAGDGIDFVRTVTIPETYHGERVTAVNTFAGSKTLEIIRIPSSVEVITLGSEGTAFYNCTSLRRVEILPLEYVQEPQYSSKDGVLFTADGKTLLFFPENKAADLENGVYTVPDGTTEIFDNAFTRASELEEVIIPAGVQRIGVRAFYSVGSDSLKRITFLATPEGAETVPLVIESQAFAANKALETVTLPARMTDVSLSDMLDTSTSSSKHNGVLQNVHVVGADGDYCSVDGVLCRKTEDGSAEIILYPEGREGDYVVPDVVVLDDGNETKIPVTSIAAETFSWHKYLTGVIIPEGITYIGESAFEYCELLVKIEFLGTAESMPLTIAEKAFYESSSYGHELRSLTLPANLVNVGAYAFGGISYLRTVTVNLDGERFADRVEINYANGAFSYAIASQSSSVTTVNLGEKVPVLSIAGVFGGAVTTVNVAEGNKNYMEAEGGVILNGDGTRFLFFPNTISGEYTVPETVTTIDAQLFRGRNITKITLGANVTSIGDYAFYSCGSLREVVFTSSTAAEGLTVGDYAFGECDSLSAISLPVGTTSIGSHAFYRCDALTSFTIPEGVTTLGEMAFAESGLTSISIPSTVTYMGESKTDTSGNYYYFDVFADCTSFASVTVDAANNSYASVDGVLYAKTVIDVNGDLTAADNYYISALAYCPVQKSGVVDVPSTVRAIWQNAFYGNQKVTEVTFSEGLKEVSYGEVVIPAELTLSQGAFQSCAALAKVTLPEGLSEIGARTFSNCNALTAISIPSTVSYIAPQAFEACMALADVTFAETPEGQTPVELVIGDSSTSTSDGVFVGCASIISLTLPERTTELGKYAFQGCIGLTTLHLPSTLTSIGQYAFQNVPLNSLTFAEGSQLKEIGSNAFNKSLLPTISLPEGLETIGSSAFAYSKLQSITIPASVRTISSSAFSYCYDLESVAFAKDSLIEELATGAFSNSYRLKSVTFDGCIAEGLEIGRTTFQYCTALESFIVPANTTLIDQYAFRYCISLTDFRFESVSDGTVSKLAEIKNYAFIGTGISEFVFPESSAASISLGIELFSACPNLTSVTLSPQVTDIGDVFTGCVRIETINVPAENKNFISSGGVIYNRNEQAVDIVLVYSVTTPDEEGKPLADENGKVVLSSNTTQIGAGAFAGRDDITSIVIPESVQSIGDNAFSGCTNLKSVTFEGASKLTSIGLNAFQYCRSLESIIIPSGVTEISNYTFDQCTSLASVTLPSGLLEIGNYAFRETELTSVSIPNTVTTFGTYVFANCPKLSEVNFNGNTEVKALGNYMFQYCTSLKTITLPASLNFLGRYTFQGSGLTAIDLSALSELKYLGKTATSITASSSSSNDVCVFADCADLASVIFPDSLTRIGPKSFQNCISLTSVNLENLDMIGGYAFQNTGLTSVHIPAITTAANLAAGAFMDCSALAALTFEEGTVRLNNYTFQNCTSLTEITLPTSLTGLQSDVFRGCTSLRKVTINSHLTSSLGDDIFTDCSALSEVTIGEGTTTLGDYMFYGLKNLKTIKLPSTLTYLGTHTFEGSGITEIDLSAMTGMTHMGSSKSACSTGSSSYVFADCKNLTRVVLPSSLTKIGAYAFYGCENLTDIDLSRIVQFNDFSFAGTPLISVTLSSDLDHVGAGVFAGCMQLENIAVRVGNTGYSSVSGVLYNEDNEIVCYPGGLEPAGGVLTITGGMGVGDGAFAGCTRISEVVIEEGVTSIGEYAFYDSAITKVTLPSTLTEIKDYAFAYSDITEIVLPESLTTIREDAFAYSALKSITVPASVTTMETRVFEGSALENVTLQTTTFGTYMFSGCGQLATVNLAEGTESLSGWMFENCSKLTTISLPDSLTKIGAGSFAGTGLTSFVFDDRFETIGNSAFLNCVSLTSVTIGQDLISSISTSGTITYATSVFSGCTNLSSVTIAEGITTIHNTTFQDCVSLKEIVLPESLTTIGSSAFAGSGLTSIVLPEKVSSLGNNAFANCTSLVSAKLSDLIYSIPSGLFSGCTALSSFELPAGIVTISGTAFQNCTSLLDFVIPSSIVSISADAFDGWTAAQKLKIEVSEVETLLWWTLGWDDGCGAQITYDYTGEGGAEI